jgi:2-polyprenyl-3-methyl-5-hydroxy-6-metoxy-1,4-benzoquinol methylase
MNPRPTEEESKAFYTEHRSLSDFPLTAEQFNKKFVAREIERVKLVEIFTSQCVKVLDVGCATGNFLRLLKGRGWQVLGIEPNVEYSEYAREQGLDIFVGTLDEAQFTDEAFHVITLFHTLEHLRNPLDSLLKVKRWLVPGGLCFIEVPNLNGLRRSMDKTYYQAHFQENHNYIFSPLTLKRMLEKAGFKVLQLRTAGGSHVVPVGITSRVATSNKKRAIFLKKFLLRPAYLLARKVLNKPLDMLGMGDAIVAIAQKES